MSTSEIYKDYHTFGSPMPNRNFNSNSYKYGFNGMEKDDEIKGNGNSLDFGARMYDSRLGRWLSVDPLQVKYPDLSPYNFAANNPIYYVDPDGKRIVVHYKDDNNKSHKLVIRKASDIEKLNYEGVGKFGSDMYKTLKYVENSDEFKLSIKTLSRVHVYENEMGDGDTRYYWGHFDENRNWAEHMILYDAHTVVYNKTDAGVVTEEFNSPASGFNHELKHFLNRLKNGVKKHSKNSIVEKNPDDTYKDPIFHSPEEKEVVTTTNKKFNEEKGEPVQPNHRAEAAKDGRKVDDPTTHSNSPGKSQNPRTLDE